MKVVVIVLNVSTGEQEQKTLDEWRKIRDRQSKTGRKTHEFVDVVEVEDKQEQKAQEARSRSLDSSTPYTNPSTPINRRAPKVPKKKGCCGRR